MALQDRVQAIREAALRTGRQPVPYSFQGITKERIRAVLRVIDRETDDIIDTVFALLDDDHDSWFSNAPSGTKFCAGATTAHIGSHVGLLQRGLTIKLDREGRDYWLKPLWELGAIEKVYFDPNTRQFINGHPVPKSQNCAYRLSEEFKRILQAPDPDWRNLIQDWISEDEIRQRAELQARLAAESTRRVDTKHIDLINTCCEHYVPNFLPGYEIIYYDIGDGDRITENDRIQLGEAGLEIGLADAMPDVLLWNRDSDHLWVIEAVTNDGEVDQNKVEQMTLLVQRHGKSGIGFTTAYWTWKDAASRQGKLKNLAPDTYLWIQEDPSKQYRVRTFD